MQFRHTTLPSGMQVIAECIPEALTSAIGLFVRTGSRDERPDEGGISHFLEHMVFKGSSARSAADVNRELDELGGQGNAYTGEEQTCYHTTVLPRFQDRAVRLLCDLLRPALRPEDMEFERLVILEEIAKYEDQPPFGATERMSELYFEGHPLAGRVLGTADSVRAITVDQMRDYLERRYAPDNIVCAAAGAIDFDRLVEVLSEECRTLTSRRDTTKRILPAPAKKRKPERLRVPGTSSAYVLRAASAPGGISPDRFAARLTASILGDEGSSRLFWELIDSGIAESAATWTQEYDDCGMFSTFIVCQPEDVKRCMRIVDRVLRDFTRNGFTDLELRHAQSRTTASLILASERPSHRMFAIGESWLALGRYESLDETLDSFRRVSSDDIHAFLKRYDLSTLVEVQVLPA